MKPRTERYKQHGAVTLMGALFIIITLVVMIQAINRMSASSITASTAQNDAVEALFIAETGIEYASYLYANGTACVDIQTTVNNTSSGRGSFDITASGLNGSDCEIAVEARVSSVGAGTPDSALRTVIAELRLSSGGAVAVGDNGTILRWDGSAWNAETSGTTEDLQSVYCPSASECWATGTDRTILHWTGGSSWTALYNSTDGSFNGVSCEPGNPSNCYAVGLDVAFKGRSDGVTRQWDGTSWADSGGGLFFDYYEDVSCPDNNCYAISLTGRAYASSSGWASDGLFATVNQHGIDCFGSNDCWSVGARPSNNTWRFYRRSSGGWTSTDVNTNRAGDLRSISCVGNTFCKAVGDRRGSRFTIASWDGSGWSEEALSHGDRDNLNGVHCADIDNCWAVGDFRNGRSTGNSLFWDGSAWSYVGTPALLDLHDVFVIDQGGGSGGAVSLVRWQEQISN